LHLFKKYEILASSFGDGLKYNRSKKMARFNKLEIETSYLITEGETGYSKGEGIQGAYAMSSDEWEEGDEAWPAGEQEFRGKAIDVAS